MEQRLSAQLEYKPEISSNYGHSRNKGSMLVIATRTNK